MYHDISIYRYIVAALIRTLWYVHTNTLWYVHTHRGSYTSWYIHIMVHTYTSWYIQTHHGMYIHIVVHTHHGNIGSDTDSPDYQRGRKVVTVQPDRYLFSHVPHEHKCMYVRMHLRQYIRMYLHILYSDPSSCILCYGSQTVLTVGTADRISIK